MGKQKGWAGRKNGGTVAGGTVLCRPAYTVLSEQTGVWPVRCERLACPIWKSKVQMSKSRGRSRRDSDKGSSGDWVRFGVAVQRSKVESLVIRFGVM